MCGIVGFIGKSNALHFVIPALYRLEYRGYDSAGISVIHNGRVFVAKKKGKISALTTYLSEVNFPSYANLGIGHTRWATHGEPSDYNAHPHTDSTGEISVIHNGIIENFLQIKNQLKHHSFVSETDTEVIPHLIEEEMKKGKDPETAFLDALEKIEGSYAIVMITSKDPNKIFCARKRSPLVVGIIDGVGYIVSSDIPSLVTFTKKVIPLDDDEVAIVSFDDVKFLKNRQRIYKQPIEIKWDIQEAEKGGYRHFMLKEIMEQPHVVEDTMHEILSVWDEIVVPKYSKILITACGTSFHAGAVGRIWFESIARKEVDIEYASELRYKDKDFQDSLIISISQSGETADTLEAVRIAKEKGAKVVGLVNVLGSSLSREADLVIHTNAGPEIGVAATKTFSAQLTALLLLALKLAGFQKSHKIVDELRRIPEKIDRFLSKNNVQDLAEEVATFKNALYLGRWISYPVAEEGALKLKEISYIHAEAYPSGEMKHGPIALISQDMLSVFVMPYDRIFKKTFSNLQEVIARKGKVISVITQGYENLLPAEVIKISIPQTDDLLSPFVSVIPLQLLSYHTAVYLGHDVDQPRNLAKSVTVE
ncbi:MAG: glutamine--fructose-6-phosphate transaminase (isomerizing) [Candidatus Calescibacterium sp.]|nr:glutamine--fructose-6-phosphate transaminase (isomerizing) [Candidatus Calescibacterium sp.]MCX7734691.1 glutamine--fructose-6-phosphate transaminase (isomerizing) [bacterium]